MMVKVKWFQAKPTLFKLKLCEQTVTDLDQTETHLADVRELARMGAIRMWRQTTVAQ